ncbi:MAG: hydrogenase iron-sulfur subunit [Candidatus Hydrothermarchaeales archaeon]
MSGIGVFLCKCGGNLGLNFKKIAKDIEKEEVKVVEIVDLLCAEKGLPHLTQHIRWSDERKLDRVVIAACSRKRDLFVRVLEAHDLGEDSLDLVNIREACAWLHEDKKAATEKARLMIRNALPREGYFPETIKVESDPGVVVLGGLEGIRIAEELLKLGAVPHVVTESYFKKDCSLCLDSQLCKPNHRQCLYDLPEVKTYQSSKFVDISGRLGDFSVRIERDKSIDMGACVECNKCIEACPKKAITSPSDGVGHVYIIDSEKCDECGACSKVCPTKAITLENVEEVIKAGHVISFSDLPPREGVYLCSGDGVNAYEEALAAAMEICMHMSGMYKEKVIDAKPELCANFNIKDKKFDIEGCTLCLDACSYGSLSSGDLDEFSCQYCGACIGACPQGVTRWMDCPQADILNEMETLSEAKLSPKVLAFHCSECGETMINTAGANGARYPPVLSIGVKCLGSISDILLLRAIDLGYDGVILSGCISGKCAHGNGVKIAAKNIAFVNKLLVLLGLQKRVKIIHSDVEDPEKFANSVKSFYDKLKPLPSTLKKKPVELDTKEMTKRQALIALIQGLTGKIGVSSGIIKGDFSFGDLQIDERKCTLCSACAIQCSTGALETSDMPRTDGWVPEIKFTHAYCTACGICGDICPEKAIHINKLLDIKRFIEISEEELKIELIKCERCGRPIMAATAYSRISGDLRGKELGLPKLCRDCRDRVNIAELLGLDVDDDSFRVIEQGKKVDE